MFALVSLKYKIDELFPIVPIIPCTPVLIFSQVPTAKSQFVAGLSFDAVKGNPNLAFEDNNYWSE